ncbi:uncharacterized protein LOC126842536 [Adelges cooleyi]|uniref:uncharacterized protein LOC126842536 n=1 Tax=Adelges cooleyi TaxID=133065 RepID=UPI0021802D70|nr:uncharacterized protein LOC126842536 [Adelges cooleyi]
MIVRSVPVHEEGVAVPEEGVAVREENRPRSLVRTAMRTLCCSSEPQDSSDLNTVPGLATERKTLFRDATKLFISSALRPGHENFGNCNLICRLKGIYRNILEKDITVTQAEVDGDQCRITYNAYIDEDNDNVNNTIVVSCVRDDIGVINASQLL